MLHSLPEYTYKSHFIRGRPALRPTFLVATMNFQLGTRRSTASSSSNTTAANPVKDDFPEALTYRFNDNSAWVPAAKTHEASLCLLTHSTTLSFPIPLFRPRPKAYKKNQTKPNQTTGAINAFAVFCCGLARLFFITLFCFFKNKTKKTGGD